MQHHEKNTQRVSEKQFLIDRLQSTIDLMPDYDPLKKFSRQQILATLCHLSAFDEQVYCFEYISQSLLKCLQDVVYLNNLNAVANGHPQVQSKQVDVLVELIRFFDWLSVLGCRFNYLPNQ